MYVVLGGRSWSWKGLSISRICRNSENNLKTKILLGCTVERLPVTDPQRIEARIRSEFRGSRFGEARGMRVAGGDGERLIQGKLSRNDVGAYRPFAVVDGKALAAPDLVAGHGERQGERLAADV